MEKTLDPWVAWRPLGDEEFTVAQSSLADRVPQFVVGSALAGAQCSDLSFYDSHLLIELRFDSSRGVERVFGLQGPDQTHWLDGNSAPVHAANDADSLALTEATVHDYLRFFCYFVRGDEGAFALIDSDSELALSEGGAAAVAEGNGSPGGDAPELQARLANARSHATPLTTRTVDERGRWVVDACVAYGGGLFQTTFAVAANGEVEMLEDEPVEVLDGIATPEYPSLDLDAIPDATPEPDDGSTVSDLVDRMRRGNLIDPRIEELPRDRAVTEAVVAVLLEDAFRDDDPFAASSHALLKHFNSQTAGDTPLAVLTRLVAGSVPVIIIESDIPFVEEFVAGLVDGPNQAVTGGAIARAGPYEWDESLCKARLDDPSVRGHLLSFHAYRGVYDAERTAHELALRDAAVFIGGPRLAEVPEVLRRIADLVLTFPRIDRNRFVRIFERVFGAKPSPGWDAPGTDWTRYLVPADFHAPRRLNFGPDEALSLLRQRIEARLGDVTPDVGPRLNELHGMGEARQICEDIVADIRAAEAGSIPWGAVDKGVLLVGAPGTGKTTLARALAKECGIKFVVASAARWQSAGALDSHLRAMRADFAEARRYAPAILFIDEIDSIGNREHLVGQQNAVYQTDVINALLEQIQGIDAGGDPVVVIGATNYVENVDPALRRAGRLDQIVELPLPNIPALEQIFDHYLEEHRDAKNVARGVKTRALAELSWGCTGADVEFFVRGAARRARRARRKIKQEDLLAEVTRRPRRPDSAPKRGKEELRRTAVHEAGHAVARLLSSTKGEDVTFITIVPRLDGSLGFVATVPLEGHPYTRRTLLERLETVLAGRAAEELVYGADDIGAGAGGPSETSDLAVATRLAELIVCQSGLGDDDALYWTSEPTPAQVKQISAMLTKSYGSIVERLGANRELLDSVVEVLEEKQELSGTELRKMLAPNGQVEPVGSLKTRGR